MTRIPDEPLDYLGGIKKLSPMELSFMKLIWAHPEGISSEEIYSSFPQARGTKSTVLYKISEKGYIQNRQCGRHHIYTAKFSESEYEQALLRQQLKKSFGNMSFECLVAAFCGKRDLTKRQLGKVKDLLKELENDLEEQ